MRSKYAYVRVSIGNVDIPLCGSFLMNEPRRITGDGCVPSPCVFVRPPNTCYAVNGAHSAPRGASPIVVELICIRGRRAPNALPSVHLRGVEATDMSGDVFQAILHCEMPRIQSMQLRRGQIPHIRLAAFACEEDVVLPPEDQRLGLATA